MTVGKIAEQSIEQYELEHLVGQDAFADTYLAHDPETKRHVLIGVLNGRFAQDVNHHTRFLKRVRALSHIRHPNIAIIYDSGETPENLPFLVSEHFEGFSLADRLERLAQQQSPAHVVYALSLMRQIASGLSLAERLGYFHYQLTPRHIYLRNITLKADDLAVLVDLAIPPEFARDADAIDDSVNANYLSPEQLSNKSIDGRSHVYSLGIMLFQLLSGSLPDKDKSSWQKPFRKMSGTQSALREIRAELSPETYALIEKAIRVRPGNRYRSIAEFSSALDQALAAEDLRIHTSELVEPRRPRPIYLVPLLLLLICLFLASSVWWIGLGNNTANGDSPPAVVAGLTEASPSPKARVNEISQITSPTAMTSTLEPPSPTNTSAISGYTARALTTPAPSATSSPTRYLQPSPTPTQTPPKIESPTPTEIIPTPWPEYRISVGSTSLRRGPGTRFDVNSYLLEDETVFIIGKSSSVDIWYIVETDDGRLGWISASVGEPTGLTNLESVVEAATIPAPPPTSTPTPTDTPAPTETPSSPSNGDGGGNGSNGGGDTPDKPKPTPTPPL